MITYSFEGKVLPTTYDTFIENVLNALFDIEPDPSLDILIRVSEAIEAQEGVAGLCSCGYQPHELASNIAHELVHARQFARNQINDVDYVWKRNGESINCEHVEYRDTPWEVEAYGLEVILTDLFWE